jgi:hypothetical protein
VSVSWTVPPSQLRVISKLPSVAALGDHPIGLAGHLDPELHPDAARLDFLRLLPDSLGGLHSGLNSGAFLGDEFLRPGLLPRVPGSTSNPTTVESFS